MEYNLGLNIGIASVGWGIVNSSNNDIIDSGVRLFPEASAENNLTRRMARGRRRLLRRKQHRLDRLKNLLILSKFIDNKDYNFMEDLPNEVYYFRRKGLSELLTDRELILSLYQLVKKRGANDYDLEDVSEDDSGIKNRLLRNEEKLNNNCYVCEVQIQALETQGKIRGKENVFKTKDFKKEALKILETQKNLGNKKVTEEFIQEYIEILERKRTYFKGPGEGSPYGWADEKEWLQGLMGKCTYFPEEIRMVKHSHSAELFNLLNDLNNLKIARDYAGEKLTDEEKKGLIEIFKAQKTVTLKKIAKFLGVDEEAIIGYRIDTTGKAVFTPLETYVTINKEFKTDDRELIDNIAEICTFYQEAEDRKLYLADLLAEYNLDDSTLEKLAKNKFTGTHAFSKKLLDILIPEMLRTTKNSMQVITELGLVPYKMNFKGQSKIDKKYIDEWIVNPVVKKSVRQCINVVNEIIKVYGTPKEIVIEMCKESSSKEERKRIKDYQANQEKENKKIKEILGSLELEKRYFPYIKFWREQNERCMLTGEQISLEDLVKNISKYEIAHIIPLSISFDNSSNNKILVKKEANLKRGTKSLFGYFDNVVAGRTFEEFEAWVKELNISKTKKELLLYKGNINRNYGDFIARNLSDTRYAVKEVKNLLDRFFKDNNKNVKIRGINNSFVNYVRNLWSLPKLKDISYSHYAEDSLILIISHSILEKLKWYKSYTTEEEGERVFYYIGTGEILDDESFKKIFNFSYRKKIADYKDYKYSHFVDKKPNRQLFNETIYSLKTFKINNKEVEYTVRTLKNLYDKDNMELTKIFDSESMEELFIYKSDIRTYSKFEKAYEDYKDIAKKQKVNPFYLYYQDNGYIKQGENNNGTSVKSLKIRDKALNTYFDISHKYINPKGKVVFARMATYRLDVYSNEKDYKLICVRYPMIKCLKDKYIIDENIYNSELERKSITEGYKFICSLYNGDIFDVKLPNIEGRFKYKGVNDEKNNKISVDYVDKNNVALITALNEVKTKLNKNPKVEISTMLNAILGTEYNEQEAKEYILNAPLASKQKILTLTKTKYLRKKSVDILGNTYNMEDTLKKTLKK